MDTEELRLIIERKENWENLIKDIPDLNFKKKYKVRIIPPYGGAVARFIVTYKDKWVSVYLDWYENLGIMTTFDGRPPTPYYELYPYLDENGEEDTKRYLLSETNELIKDIEKILEG